MEENNNKLIEKNVKKEEKIIENNKKEKKSKGKLIILFLTVIVFVVGLIYLNTMSKTPIKEKNKETTSEIKKSSYRISGNSLQSFDLYFLQLENEKQNKIYSPLSIKYALGMLEEGAEGESKTQISNIIGSYQPKKYINSKNASFANGMFINSANKETIKDSYITSLKDKYNAEVIYDGFETPITMNTWVKDKTLGLIDNLFDDVSGSKFILINALAIDMEWKEKFILYPGTGLAERYLHENFSWYGAVDVTPEKFEGINEDISGMEIIASFNNYDIVNVLGEEKIRETVKTEFEKYLAEYPEEKLSDYVPYEKSNIGLSDEELMDIYLDEYISDINSNYKKEDKTTDFSLYVDENVKVFAKDLKEYDGLNLQYVAIMPVKEDLDSYISKVKVSDINKFIKNLKSLKAENFKDGVVTLINGYIPKFKFDYELDLIADLKKLGITNVFEPDKANLTNLSSAENLYINSVIHKSTIEFTQDGIKASAATAEGGFGAGGGFDYCFDVPVEEIDLTFNKPYMFIIRDKNTGEVWFTGTVYNPLLYSEDTTKIIGEE